MRSLLLLALFGFLAIAMVQARPQSASDDVVVPEGEENSVVEPIPDDEEAEDEESAQDSELETEPEEDDNEDLEPEESQPEKLPEEKKPLGRFDAFKKKVEDAHYDYQIKRQSFHQFLMEYLNP